MRKIKELLLRRFVTHSDPDAFSEIVRQHAGMVYGACLRILRDEDKAADAAQETFFQLLRNAEQITGSVAGWLHRAATCRAIDRIRRDAIRRQHEQKYSQDNPRRVENWEQISPWIDEELDKLDDQTRDILTRHYFAGQTTRDIGKEIGISQATVSRRIEAGLDLLRTRLSKRGLIVAAAALGGLLGQNAAQAAPAVLVTELGKMALVAGTTGIAASGAGAATVSAGEAAAGGILAGAKVKIITAAAVVVIGTGSVVTYHHYADSPKPANTTVQSGTDQPENQTAKTSQSPRTSEPGSNVTYIESSAESSPAAAPDTENPDDFDEWFDSLFVEETLPAGQASRPAGGGTAMGGGYGGFGGGMMGGMAAPAPEEEIQEETIYYGGAVRARVAPPPEESQENEEEQ